MGKTAEGAPAEGERTSPHGPEVGAPWAWTYLEDWQRRALDRVQSQRMVYRRCPRCAEVNSDDSLRRRKHGRACYRCRRCGFKGQGRAFRFAKGPSTSIWKPRTSTASSQSA